MGDFDVKKKPLPDAEIQDSLKQEILQLEKRLQDQLMVRGALEKALGFRSSALNSSNDMLMPKPAKELIREIAVLELKVTYLEQYLLSLYRKAFDQQISTISPPSVGEISKRPSSTQPPLVQETAKLGISYNRRNPAVQSDRIQLPREWVINAESEVYEAKSQEKLAGPGIHWSHSLLSQRAVCSARISPSEESLARALYSCHSQPLSFLKEKRNATSGVTSLAEYLGTSLADDVPETPNKLSENMILQLEKRLQDQLMVRGALEKALGFRSSALNSSNDMLMPKPAKELIREIAVLELKVTYLEQYLLSLYRKAFDQQISTISPPSVGEISKRPSSTQPPLVQETAKLGISYNRRNPAVQSDRIQLPREWVINAESEVYEAKSQEKLAGPGIHWSHSLLSQRAVCSARISPSEESLARALYSCHSQPLSFLKEKRNATSGVTSLAEYLGTSLADDVPETPNKLSENMPAKELIREIAVLELKVTYLEQYLLSLYRKAFDQQISTISPPSVGEISKRPSSTQPPLVQETAKLGISYNRRNPAVQSDRIQLPREWVINAESEVYEAKSQEKLAGPGIHWSHSLLSQRAVCSARISPSEESLARALYSCHSQPLSFLKEKRNATSGVTSLAEYLGTSLADDVPETPNKLSENMAHLEHGIPQNNARKASLLIKWLRMFFYPRMKYKAGDGWQAYAIEQPEPLLRFALCSGSLSDPAEKRNATSGVTSLAEYLGTSLADDVPETPNKLSENMAHLEHGIPQNNARKASLLIKWLRMFFYPRMKYKAGDGWQAYAIEQPEPLLRFALCSGSLSDPAVRIYTSKRLFQQLEAAKEEFIRASVSIWKEQKILLPKMIDAYAKDARLSSQFLADMIQRHLPESLRMAIQRCQQGRANKFIEWIPYNYTFRYLLSRELAFPQINRRNASLR
ncbi:hypothetical protein COCNU_scaffold014964G000030 [Cocos nucifera]|nr:hypothetical protein [Cocos nucifera]